MPDADAKEASLVEGTKIAPIASLSQLVSYFRGEIPAPEFKPDEVRDYPIASSTTDLAYIKGQENVKRVLEVSAAGGHNVVMMATPLSHHS